MSIPLMRRPKQVEKNVEKNNNTISIDTEDYMILTLKNGKKLVVSSDSYHGIITCSNIYKCVICNDEFNLAKDDKENHKRSHNHKQLMILYPHKEDFAENLIRQIESDICYCTICNVVVPTRTLMRHLSAEGHIAELKKAKLRSFTYQPLE
ncbi:uncharacterized protein LOC123704791 [Colias croceus]|uniref:uncharacterized protein LOC123704791 n=1 Tax=Colias crocea TaxID=72248 RepID=UPI001E27B0CE|nr:uncharacterized protein LOC123704791 [Colias croceus]